MVLTLTPGLELADALLEAGAVDVPDTLIEGGETLAMVAIRTAGGNTATGRLRITPLRSASSVTE
jgi:hypothetical protein